MDIYHLILNCVLSVKIFLVAVLIVLLTSQGLFKRAKKWRWGFIVGAVIYIAGMLADLTDGASDLQELRYYALARHVGSAMIFACVIGMHWHLFKKPLLGGTVFARFFNLDD